MTPPEEPDPDLLAAHQEGQAAIAAGDCLDADQLADVMRNAGRPPMSNRAVEDAAVAFVVAYEAEHGRVASDTRGRGAAGDVESDDGRLIEVKAYGRSARGTDLWLETRQLDEARSNPAFHVYVVDNVRQGDPVLFRLIDLHGDVLAGLLQRARPQTYVTVPFPVAVYDAVIADAIG